MHSLEGITPPTGDEHFMTASDEVERCLPADSSRGPVMRIRIVHIPFRMWMLYSRTMWYVNTNQMAYQSDLRAAKKRDTRKALIDAAVDLCFEQGIEGPSLDAICAAAGCTRGAFYVHFKTREDIVIAAMERTLGDFLQRLLATGAADADPAAFVDTFLAAIAARTPLVGGSKLRFRHLLEACARYPAVRQRYLMIIDAATARCAQGSSSARFQTPMAVPPYSG